MSVFAAQLTSDLLARIHSWFCWMNVRVIPREKLRCLLQLPAAQRKIIREVILTFAKANGVAEVHTQK